MTQWNYELAKEAAQKFTTKREFDRAFGGAYAWARRNGVLEEITSHMRKDTIWNKESALEKARKFNNRSKFTQAYPGCAKWLRRYDLWEDACAHMDSKFEWTYELVKKEASKFSSRNEFHKHNASAAQWANRNGCMNELFPHQLSIWDFNSVSEEARKYSHREEFRTKSAGAAQWAARNGVWDDVCSHMQHQNPCVSLEEAVVEAKKYSTRAELYHNSPRVYAWALRNNCMDQVCAHMSAGINASDADAIYIWAPSGISDVFKFGVSSVRLADHRIQVVARAGGLDVDFYTIRYCVNARQLERELLSLGQPYNWSRKFDGCTEFRYLEPREIDKAFELVQPYEEAA